MWVLDYGWHYGPYTPQPPGDNGACHDDETDYRRACPGGFGGYMVDRGAFPDPQAFFDWIHDVAGLELVLNIHDQCGVNNCQANYRLVAAAVGDSPAAPGPVACAILNKTFMRALHDLVLEAGDLKHVDYYW